MINHLALNTATVAVNLNMGSMGAKPHSCCVLTFSAPNRGSVVQCWLSGGWQKFALLIRNSLLTLSSSYEGKMQKELIFPILTLSELFKETDSPGSFIFGSLGNESKMDHSYMVCSSGEISKFTTCIKTKHLQNMPMEKKGG